METRDKFVMSVAFSPDNKYLASGGLDGLVNIFDVEVSLRLGRQRKGEEPLCQAILARGDSRACRSR